MFCTNCGAAISPEQRFCGKCGASAVGTSVPATSREAPELPPQLTIEVPYASFGRRLAGFLIDYILTVIVLGSLLALAAAAEPMGAKHALWMLVTYVGLILYSLLFESSRLQATPGKLAVGIKVTDLEGRRISLLRAIGRLLAHVLSGLTLCAGYVMAVFTRKRQTLHDLVAGTLVVRKAFSIEEIAASGDAPKVPVWAAVLVVIGVVFFGPSGLGILAAIAIPAYQNYTIRAQVVEGLNAADDYKTAISEAHAKGGHFGSLSSDNLQLPTHPSLHYVDSVEVASGVIVIKYGRGANGKIVGKELLLIPGTTTNDDIVWVCGRANAPLGVALAIKDAAQYTTVGDQYLPAACR